MPITSTSYASIKSAKTIEKTFATSGSVLTPRKLIAGGYDPANTSVVEGEVYEDLTAAKAATIFGYGSQLHRMVMYSILGSTGAIQTDVIALPAAASGVAATKTITFATTATSSGKFYFRLGSYLTTDLLKLTITNGETVSDAADALVTLVNNKSSLPFTASATTGVVTLTAKTADETSEDLLCTVSIGDGEDDYLPSGMTVTIADGTTGADQSDLTGLTDYLEAEDTPRYTSVVQPYYDTDIMDTFSTLVGNPNDVSGLYDDLDYRPFNCYFANTTGGSAQLDVLTALGAARLNDCANVLFAAPSYPELAYEIACYVSGIIDLQSLTASSNGYTRLSLSYLWGPITPSDDFTTHSDDSTIKAYENRNDLVTAGIAPIIYKDGLATPGDVTGFWHPDDNQNAPFKYVVNRIKIWNIRNLVNEYLNKDSLKDCPIVYNADAVKPSERPVDVDILKTGLSAVAGICESYAWLYAASFTITNMTVTENEDNPDRFDITFPVIISGNNRVNSAEIDVDRNLQAVDLTISTAA